jgi:hypothetical protein
MLDGTQAALLNMCRWQPTSAVTSMTSSSSRCVGAAGGRLRRIRHWPANANVAGCKHFHPGYICCQHEPLPLALPALSNAQLTTLPLMSWLVLAVSR